MRAKDVALALVVVVAWGLNFVVVKVGVTHIPPLLLGALRFMLAAFPALLFVPRPRLPLKLYLAYGLTASVGQFAFLFTAVHLGMPTGLAAALSWASSNIVTRVIGARGPINQLGLVVWGSLVPPIPFLLMSAWLEGPAAMGAALQAFNWEALAALAYLAGVATLFGYSVWTRLLTLYPANQVAPFSLLVPVVGLTTGWVVYGEALQPVHFAGAALLMLGLGLNLWGGRWLARLRVAR